METGIKINRLVTEVQSREKEIEYLVDEIYQHTISLQERLNFARAIKKEMGENLANELKKDDIPHILESINIWYWYAEKNDTRKVFEPGHIWKEVITDGVAKNNRRYNILTFLKDHNFIIEKNKWGQLLEIKESWAKLEKEEREMYTKIFKQIITDNAKGFYHV